ncbi:Retinal dehydrogenase 1 [Acrodontium crateriforme]|uniref:aldehyde dehydrogenase (NAD(+)) n=1 Tax=Acrodontium crateriforme TaxID=150365 RepID=A0AAQ3MAH9_9PEZI|nr:Retinal dehydrogenase 1 [Acrodontium crateriforme]
MFELPPINTGFTKLVVQESLGVCAAINPFNGPAATMMIKLAPALASGNFMVVTGAGKPGALLASHMRIRKTSFTGSIGTGKSIQVAAVQSNLERVTLELGGKSPAMIFDDANLDNALTWTINAILARSGQVCVTATRVYVHKAISEEFIKR